MNKVFEKIIEKLENELKLADEENYDVQEKIICNSIRLKDMQMELQMQSKSSSRKQSSLVATQMSGATDGFRAVSGCRKKMGIIMLLKL